MVLFAKISSATMTNIFPCRVKYLDDTDPFAINITYPQPPRAPVYVFRTDTSLGEQIPAIHKVLGAPQRVSHCYTKRLA